MPLNADDCRLRQARLRERLVSGRSGMHEDAKSGWTMRFVGRRRPQKRSAPRLLSAKSCASKSVSEGQQLMMPLSVTGRSAAVAASIARNLSIYSHRLIESDVRTTEIDCSGCNGCILRRLSAG